MQTGFTRLPTDLRMRVKPIIPKTSICGLTRGPSDCLLHHLLETSLTLGVTYHTAPDLSLTGITTTQIRV
jgi:hypothetical protein